MENPVPREGHLARIVREAGVPDLVEVLADRLQPTDLQSLLLEVYRRRAGRLTPAQLFERAAQDRFARPSEVDPAALAAFDALAWSLLPAGYSRLELSPVCPLGTNSVIATVDQNKVITTIRNGEAVADPTNVLAVECAARRRQGVAAAAGSARSETVRLAASHRVVRAQLFDHPLARPHFRLLGLAAAGRDRGSFRFETETLCEQLCFLVELILQARPGGGPVRIALTDLCGRPEVWERGVLEVLAEGLPSARLGMDPQRSSGRGYYVNACFKLFAAGPSGEEVELADGGCTTWTRQLLSDAKERLVIAGLGVERVLGLPLSS
jgi:hypothetical protein